MDWVSQNWGWIAVLVGGYVLMTRMGGCGMSMRRSCSSHHHAGGHHQHAEDDTQIAPIDPDQGRRESNGAH